VNEILEPLESFNNFNEFFYRKLKEGVRPISHPENVDVAVSPADCRLNVFETIDCATEIWIKGKNFNLQNLLLDDNLVSVFNGGSLVISRLAPQDYHRFHLPVSGAIGETTHHDGAYYTVNPIAIRESIDVFTENRRAVTLIHSESFGLVLMVAVGAAMVGSIVLTTQNGQHVQKGDEHGYFAFGGSTVLTLFQKNTITFDNDLIVNSQKPIETYVKMGTSIGRRNR
jgi:phosphatidylserine decarboxylase